MSKRQGRIGLIITIAIFAIIIAVPGVYAQYNGECWAADYTNVIKISSNGKVTKFAGFSQPLSLSVSYVDGSCWVADTDAVRVRKLSASGKELVSLDETNFSSNPMSVSVDPRDGSCWVGVIDTVYKFSSEAKQLLKRDGFNEPILAVNPRNGECWVADSNNARIVKLSPDGKQLGVYQIEGFSQPKSISLNPADGSCWVLDPFAQKVARLSSDGKVLTIASVAPASGAIMATSVSAAPDGCWVALMIDTMNDQVLKLSIEGKQILSVGGFSMPNGLAYDPIDKGCWVADSNNGQIVKLSANGQKILAIKGFDQTKAVSVAHPLK